MTEEQFMREARRYAKHIYCYEELIDDAKETFMALHEAGVDCYDAVERVGEEYDLDRADQGWGINQGKRFEKLEGRQ